MRRDYGRIMDLIEAHAVLHQETRERDQDGRIVATLDDYSAVHALIADIVGEASEVAVSDTVRKTVETVRELINEGQDVTRNTLAKNFGIVPTSAGRRFAPATAAGYIKEDPDNPNAKPKRYVLGDVSLPENVEVVIPNPERLGSCVSASGARGVGASNKNRASDDFGNARSGASARASSDDSVVSENQKLDRNRKLSEAHDNESTVTGVSQDRTHGRTTFTHDPQLAAETNTVRASVRNIVRATPSYEVDAACTAENPELWKLLTSLPADYLLPFEEHVKMFKERYGPSYSVHTPQQLVFNYVTCGYAKPKFRIRDGRRVFTGLVAA